MDKSNYKNTFDFFIERIKYHKINWVLTGSYRLFLESDHFFNNSDIDILTDKSGAKVIETIFSEWIISDFKHSETNGLRSYFGQLKINEITFDIMCDVQNKIGNRWFDIPNLNRMVYLELENCEVPVLPLSVESEISKALDQELKNLRINEIISTKMS